MATPDRGVRIEAIREAARLAAEASSLRRVARQMGLSPMGLKNFLDGRSPYAATRRKLTVWFVRHGTEGGVDEDVARGALSLMLQGLPDAGYEPGTQRLLAEVEDIHRTFGTQPPAWVRQLRTNDDEDS